MLHKDNLLYEITLLRNSLQYKKLSQNSKKKKKKDAIFCVSQLLLNLTYFVFHTATVFFFKKKTIQHLLNLTLQLHYYIPIKLESYKLG